MAGEEAVDDKESVSQCGCPLSSRLQSRRRGLFACDHALRAYGVEKHGESCFVLSVYVTVGGWARLGRIAYYQYVGPPSAALVS